jgi:ATP-dependent DNA helicase RecG
MRPTLLDPLFAPASALPGVGPKNAKLFDRLLDRPNGARVLDLLFHLPTAAIDRRARPKIRDAQRDAIATLEVRVAEHRPPASNRKGPFKVLVEDDTGDVELIFFLANVEWVKKRLPLGATRWVSGKLEMWDGHLQMVHPDKVMDEFELGKMAPVEPVYGLTEGLYPRTVQKASQAGLARLPALPEWIDEATLARLEAPSFAEALERLHNPQSPADVEPTSVALGRLAYDELLANQLALLLVRARMRALPGRAQASEGRVAATLLAALPYQLTDAQSRAIEAIRADLAAPQRMIRLLQGDVGSGKTVVALMAMAHAVEAGRQAALMAPTEILARQHFERLKPLGETAGLRLALFTGRDAAATRRGQLAALAAGEIDIAVGTHALFQESVEFHDLGLAVVDEQHRFGVHQRLALAGKGDAADLLVMTATPIPRTVLLTQWGEMAASRLRGRPAGRKPIATSLHALATLPRVTEAIGRKLAEGARVYWVCPLVAESEFLDLAAAEARFEHLRERFGDQVGLAHGRQDPEERAAALEAFAQGRLRLLVATTVIEVGVDVPSASVMVVEHAERFGLAQLHQLRGRVGRGAAQSFCLLLHADDTTGAAKRRLTLLRATDDGFRIAEADFLERGGGDALGTRQSGLPGFRIADPVADADALATAAKDAALLLHRDPHLTTPRGHAARLLLRFFGRHRGMRALLAG